MLLNWTERAVAQSSTRPSRFTSPAPSTARRAGAYPALIALLAMACMPRIAAGQDLRAYATRSGLTFSLPTALQPQANTGVLLGAAKVEHAFSDGLSQPLQVFVVSGPTPTQPNLPLDRVEVRQRYADGFIEGARALFPELDPSSSEPVAYDAERGAFALRITVSGPAKARTMLDEPEEGPSGKRCATPARTLRCYAAFFWNSWAAPHPRMNRDYVRTPAPPQSAAAYRNNGSSASSTALAHLHSHQA